MHADAAYCMQVLCSTIAYVLECATSRCYEQDVVCLYGLGLLLYTLGHSQIGVYHSGTPLLHLCLVSVSD